MKHILWIIIIGIIAGWLSGKIMKGRGFGLVGNLVVGIVGAVIGGVLFEAVGLIAYGFIGNLISATVGAIVLIFALRTISENR